ncbi:unnamed protein product [Arctia plantaginis]|uniref:Uncharacterized protein n=1 Tax=Arctia plantaginis TaxID=874455 RepID=A0A8S1BN17_ARCPL|nr:unnamed protein product [Arctia plantaginis]
MLKIVRPMKEVFKIFIIDMEKQKQSLKSISWDVFEQWALNAGLSTMYTNFHQMVWETDFEETLFRIFGEIYSQDAEEQSEISEDEECSLLPNTKTTSTLSTTVRTEEDPADADICDISVNTRPRTKKTVKFSSLPGHRSSEVSTSKLKMNSKKIQYGLGEAASCQTSHVIGHGRGGDSANRKETTERHSQQSTSGGREHGQRCFRQLRRFARRSCPTAIITLDHWCNLTEYLSKAPRSISYFEVAGRTWVESGEVRDIPLQRLYQETKDGMVEECGVSAEPSCPMEPNRVCRN